MNQTRAILLGLLLLVGSAPAAEVPVASDPVFAALLVDGGKVSGRIRQFGATGDVTLVPLKGSAQTIPFENLIKLTREGLPTSLVPEASVILFPEGDRIHRTAVGAANETSLDVQSYTLGHLAIPLDSILGLTLALQADGDALQALNRRLRSEPRTSEVVWLANGDRLTGGFLGITDKSVEFQPGKDPVKLDRAGIDAIGFDPKLVAYPRLKSNFFELTFSDGSRLGVTGVRIDQGYVLGTTRFGAAIRVQLSDLLGVHARSPSVVYLTDRQPAAEKYVPYIGPPRPFQRDANVAGQSLRLSGQDFDRGLGSQSRTILAYRLEPGDKRFQALIGVDDRAGTLGSVIFRVLVDGKERYLSPSMSARDVPRTIDVELSGAKSLFLITEFGDRGGVRDMADWVEARLIR